MIALPVSTLCLPEPCFQNRRNVNLTLSIGLKLLCLTSHFLCAAAAYFSDGRHLCACSRFPPFYREHKTHLDAFGISVVQPTGCLSVPWGTAPSFLFTQRSHTDRAAANCRLVLRPWDSLLSSRFFSRLFCFSFRNNSAAPVPSGALTALENLFGKSPAVRCWVFVCSLPCFCLYYSRANIQCQYFF